MLSWYNEKISANYYGCRSILPYSFSLAKEEETEYHIAMTERDRLEQTVTRKKISGDGRKARQEVIFKGIPTDSLRVDVEQLLNEVRSAPQVPMRAGRKGKRGRSKR